MNNPRPIAALLLSLLYAGSLAHAQAPRLKPEESCADIERGYDMIKAEAVSMQINIALFAAASIML